MDEGVFSAMNDRVEEEKVEAPTATAAWLSGAALIVRELTEVRHCECYRKTYFKEKRYVRRLE